MSSYSTVGLSATTVVDRLLAVARAITRSVGRVDEATWHAARTAGWSEDQLAEAFAFAGLTHYVDAFAMVDRLQLLDGGGYSSYAPALEDYEQWLHLATNGRGVVFVPLVFGYYYVMPNSMIVEANHLALTPRMRRVFDQLGCRKHLTLPTNHLRYHPAIGYL